MTRPKTILIVLCNTLRYTNGIEVFKGHIYNFLRFSNCTVLGDIVLFQKIFDLFTSRLMPIIKIAKEKPEVNLIFNEINFFGNEAIIKKYKDGWLQTQKKV